MKCVILENLSTITKIESLPIFDLGKPKTKFIEIFNEDQPNTKLNQNIWSKMELGTLGEHEGQPLIHLIQIQEEPNSCGLKG
jgi:hypothetical protein